MSKTTRTAAPAKAAVQAPVAARTVAARQVVTLESAAALSPTDDVMNKVYTVFALDPVPVAEIREGVEEHLALQARLLGTVMNDKALDIHLQRVVGAYVGSAYGAASFYDAKRRAARELTSQFNELRDEDREGPSGFESRVEKAQEFAAQMAVQSVATLAAAEGAVSAYAHATGNTWKPYVSPVVEGQGISRQAAAARMSAFD